MPAFNLNRFSGILPRVPATSLPEGAATIAQNIDFAYGNLTSANGDFTLMNLSQIAQSVFSEDGLRFYTWPGDVDALISPLGAGELNDRLYYTTGSDFRVTPRSLATTNGGPPSTSYRVGVPRPSIAPVVTVVNPPPVNPGVAKVDADPADTYATRLATAQATLDAQVTANTQIITESRAYTYTYANVDNEEGPASPPTVVDVIAQTYNGVTTYSTVTVQVNFDANPGYVPFGEARVYRTSAGGTTADYYYAFSEYGSSGAASMVDNIDPSMLNEPLSSMDAYPPPVNLKGLINVGNGILAAWNGNQMWFSDAYRPWSWPPQYMIALKYPIVGAIGTGTGALVTTVSQPTIVTGVSPDAMTMVPVDVPQAGVSKWSLISMNGVVLYATNEGIMMLEGGMPSLEFSQKYFTRATWRKKYAAGLATMQFAHYDGRLVVFSKTAAFTPFMIEISEGGGAMTELPNLMATTALVLATSDQMYTVNGTALNQFCGGSPLPLTWQSGDMILPAPTVLTCAEAECNGNFTIQFYQRGVLGFTQQITTGNTVFRLPAQAIPGQAGLPPSDRWQINISGTGTLVYLKMASSFRALATV